jgi:hypothetical protein
MDEEEEAGMNNHFFIEEDLTEEAAEGPSTAMDFLALHLSEGF